MNVQGAILAGPLDWHSAPCRRLTKNGAGRAIGAPSEDDMMWTDDDTMFIRLIFSTVSAAFIGCALGAAGMMGYALLEEGMHSDSILMSALFIPVLALFGLFMALPATVALGIPFVLLLKHFRVRGILRFATLSAVGSVSGPLVWNVINGTHAVGADRIGAIMFGLTCGFACGWTTRRFAVEV